MDESKLKPDPEKLEHYYLVTGNIVFTVGEDTTNPISAGSNAVVTSVDGRLSVVHLARTQQALQAQFHQKIGSELKIEVIDVVIMGMISLGVFTKEQFNRLPEGMKLVERPPITETAEATTLTVVN